MDGRKSWGTWQWQIADEQQVNGYRTARVAEVLEDFRTLQYYIAAAPTEPPNADDHYTEGWAALRQCAIDGQRILECAADTRVPSADGEEEQYKAELKQYVVVRCIGVCRLTRPKGSFLMRSLDATRVRRFISDNKPHNGG